MVFFWGFVSHGLLPIGDMGLSPLPEQDRLSSILRDELGDSGVYLFPHADPATATAEEQEAAKQAYEKGPTGFLVYHPTGTPQMSVNNFVIEFLGNLICAFIAAVILSNLRGGYGMRVIAVTLLGVFAWIATNVSYANWFRFTETFTTAAGIMLVVGWFLAGLVMAAIVKQDHPAEASATA